MVAPNGARLKKKDHPGVPVTVAETVKCAVDCYNAGAHALHAHVRDAEEKHVLDAGLYKELVAELKIAAPDLDVQITTEAVGIYSALDQRKLVKDVAPSYISVAMKEQDIAEDQNAAKAFYHWLQAEKIRVQHILYSAEELQQFLTYLDTGVIPSDDIETLFVMGRYSAGQKSDPSDLDPFLAGIPSGMDLNWSICAFGDKETDCLLYAAKNGGGIRIGFENNRTNKDLSVAKENAERVTEIKTLLVQNGLD